MNSSTMARSSIRGRLYAAIPALRDRNTHKDAMNTPLKVTEHCSALEYFGLSEIEACLIMGIMGPDAA